MPIPLDLARTLAVVVEEGTLDAAARRLHITPSAVSQRVRALEDQLGRVVLVRSKPVRATAAGDAVVRLARQLALLEHDALAAMGAEGGSVWPLRNAVRNAAGGAPWGWRHDGGGGGRGFSQHSGMVIVGDGTDEAAERIAWVLTNDPGTGVMRHADAGYQIAIDCAREQGLNLPMIGSQNKGA